MNDKQGNTDKSLMRPTTSIMLQQNNNNNYPCLNVPSSTLGVLQKCSRASLPFPSRLELGLGDLPLIRGLRAWALCSKNRCKAGDLLGVGQVPSGPPAGSGRSTSCPRPADVYLSKEWGRMGYGLPLGLDARQAGIGALVTVASLKTSEGSGKTQTQCLFLRTEKGSCLYSTAKPAFGLSASTASSGVGGWLRGKTRVRGRDAPTERRDNGPELPTQPGTNRVRVRSGRRWRKSGNAAGREKTGMSKERQQKSREGPARQRQEEQEKGGLGQHFPSMQQDGSSARQETEGLSAQFCHEVSPKNCVPLEKRTQRRESQDEGEGGERQGDFPNRLNNDVKEIRKDRQRNEEEKGGLCDSTCFLQAESNSNLESNCLPPKCLNGCDGEEIREADSNRELEKETSQDMGNYSEKEQDTNSEMMKIHIGNNDFINAYSVEVTDDFQSRHRGPTVNPCKAIVNKINIFSEYTVPDEGSNKEMERVVGEEDIKSICQSPKKISLVSNFCEDIFVSSTSPAEGSIGCADHKACGVDRGHENGQLEQLEGPEGEENSPGTMGYIELDGGEFDPKEPNCRADVKTNTGTLQLLYSQMEEREVSCSFIRNRDPSIFKTERKNATGHPCHCRTVESEQRNKLESIDKNKEKTLNPEEVQEIPRRAFTYNEPESGSGKDGSYKELLAEDETNINAMLDTDYKEVRINCAPEEYSRLQEFADRGSGRKKNNGDTCGGTNINPVEENKETYSKISITCAGPFTQTNPDPFLHPVGDMATGPNCLGEEEKEEEGGVGGPAGDAGQEVQRTSSREQGEPSEEERASTLATEEEQREEEDEFGVFVQADREPAWSQEVPKSASVPCGSRRSAGIGNHVITGESTHWTDNSFHQSDTTWTAFPQGPSDKGGDMVGKWWPSSAAEERIHGLATVFAEAFSLRPGTSSSDPCDPDPVPTLTQLLRGRASLNQRLLHSFHDLNKMIGQRYKSDNAVSCDLLLTTLHMELPHTDSRSTHGTANRRLSPGLPSANQHGQNAAAKRRLS